LAADESFLDLVGRDRANDENPGILVALIDHDDRESFIACFGSEVRVGLACCKVGLDRLLIPAAFVANLFRSARVSRLRRNQTIIIQRQHRFPDTARPAGAG
jgi:hypothetical protein